jgi:hypothetical protein
MPDLGYNVTKKLGVWLDGTDKKCVHNFCGKPLGRFRQCRGGKMKENYLTETRRRHD